MTLTFDLTCQDISLVTALVDQATQQGVQALFCTGGNLSIEIVALSQYVCILAQFGLQIGSV